MSDTPRTDALHTKLLRISEGPNWIYGKDYVDMAEHARQLERELAAARQRESVDSAELQYWRDCNADTMTRKDHTDGMSHKERVGLIRIRALAGAQNAPAAETVAVPFPVGLFNKCAVIVGTMDGYEGKSPDADHFNWLNAMLRAAKEEGK